MIEVQLPDGRLINVQTNDPNEAARAARIFLDQDHAARRRSMVEGARDVQREQTRAAGVTARGLVEGALALPGVVYDAVAAPINLAARGVNMLTGAQIPQVRSAAQNTGAVLDATGLPTPANAAERFNFNLSQQLGGAASGIAGPVASAVRATLPAVGRVLASSPGAQAAGAAGAGIGQSAAQALDTGPVGEAVGAVAGGMLGGASVPAAQTVGNTLAALVRPLTRPGVEEAAGNALLRSATDPRAIGGRLTQPRPAYVADSAPTTAEVVNDPGLLQMERTLRAADPARGGEFALRDAARDASRTGMARAVEPTTSGAEEVNTAVTTSLAGVRSAAANAEQTALRAADERIAALGDRIGPQQAGEVIRREFDDAYRAARRETRAAYQVVGDLEVPLRPIGQAAFDATARYYGPGGGAPPAAVTALLDEVRAAEGARVGFDWWQRFRSRAGAEAAVAQRQGDSRAAAVFGAIRDAADDALSAAAAAGRTATPDQAAALAAAQQTRATQASRFETGVADQARRTDYGRPVMAPSVLPGAFFQVGDKGQQGARQFLAAVGDRAAATDAMRGFVVDRLLASATRPDGSIDPARLNAFVTRYRGALNEFPDLFRGVINAEAATRTLEAARAAGRTSVDDAERGVARFFLNNDPRVAIERVIDSGARVQNMQALRELVAHDPVALSGLRRSFIDVMLGRATTTAPDAAGNFRMSPASFENFWRQNEDVARVIFRPEEVGMFQNIAADFVSGNRVNTVNRAVGSNTFQNATTAMVLGQVTGGLLDPLQMERAAGSTAGRVLRLLYGGAEQQVQDLVYKAMLEPEVARALVSRATPRNLSIVTGYLERTASDRLREIAQGVAMDVAPAGINAGVQVQQSP